MPRFGRPRGQAISSAYNSDRERIDGISFPLVSATGMLGSGIFAPSRSTRRFSAQGARNDRLRPAGSTDPGPGPLATGRLPCSRPQRSAATPEIMMTQRGGEGRHSADHRLGRHVRESDAGLAWMVDIVHEIAPRSRISISSSRSFYFRIIGRKSFDGTCATAGARALPNFGAAERWPISMQQHNIVGMMGGRADTNKALYRRRPTKSSLPGRSSDTSIFARAGRLLEGYCPGRFRLAHGQNPRIAALPAVAVRTAPDCHDGGIA